MGPKTYIYEPLPTTRHIRLIQLDDSNDPLAPITFTFATTSLDDPCIYQTLSYTWGETFPDGSHLTHEIVCEGRSIRITANLHDFLVRLRSKLDEWDISNGVPLWADAVCINQSDAEERSQQVIMMADIYEKSHRLVIWLGEVSVPPGLGYPFGALMSEFDLSRMPATPEVSVDTAEWKALTMILGLPWFGRRWIIQEVLHTEHGDRSLWFGESEMTWSFFLEAVKHANLEYLAGPPVRLMVEKSMKASSRSESNQSLLQNLWLCDGAQCGDARDQIFAVLSISWDYDDYRVSYAKPWQDVYVITAVDMLRSKKRDNLLSLLACATTRTETEGLPSWVPDWQKPIRCTIREQEDCVNDCFSEVMSIGTCVDRDSMQILENEYLVLIGWPIPACCCSSGIMASDCKVCALNAEAQRQVRSLLENACHENVIKSGQDHCSTCERRKQTMKIFKSRCWAALEPGQTLCLLQGSRVALILSTVNVDQLSGITLYRLVSCFRISNYWNDGWWEQQMDGKKTIMTLV